MQKNKLFHKLASIIIVTTIVWSNSVLATLVSTSQELINAIDNLDVNHIIFAKDITLEGNLSGNETPRVTRNLIIDGNGYALYGNYNGFDLGDSELVNYTYVINNLNFNGLNEGIWLANTKSLTINNCNFTNNAYDGDGAAIYNTGNVNFNGAVNFANNSASYSGAIDNYGSMIFKNVANFTNNRANKSGGAIYNNNYNDIENNIIFKGSITFDNGSSFIGNNAGRNGGAVYNEANITFNGISNFESNSANEGGAIFNNAYIDLDINIVTIGTINFNADANFFNNFDSTGPNDIYNDGVVNINAGTTTIGGGISGKTGTLNVNSAILNLGTSKVTQGAVNFAKNSILDIQYTDSNTTRITTSITNIVTDSDGNIIATTVTPTAPTIDTGAKIIINKAGDYQLFNSSPASGNVFSNLLYNIKDTNGRYTITGKNQTQIINDVNTSAGVMLGTNDANALISMDDLKYNIANSQVVNIFKGAQTGNVNSLNQVKHLTYSSAATTQAIATGSQNSIIDITGRRTSLINETKPGTAPWMQLIYNHKKQNTTGDNPGFFSNTKGAAVGVDKTTTDYMLGLGYAYNDTNLSSNGTDTDADGHNIFTYAHYQLNHNWFVNGVVNAGFSGHYDENPLRNAKHNVNAYGGQVLTGYDLAGLKSAKYDLSGLKPELGVRYIYINTGSYTDSIGTKFNLNNINVLTGFLGGIYGREFAGKNNKFTITPEVKLGATYDVVSSNQDGIVTILGTANSYTATTNKLPKFGMEAGIGATIHVQQFYITLNYDAFKRKDYLSQTGMLKLKCEL